MPLFFGEKRSAIGDHEAKIAGAGLIDAGKIHFIDDAVTQSKPDFAMLVQGCANAGFGARSPARWNTGPARGKAR